MIGSTVRIDKRALRGALVRPKHQGTPGSTPRSSDRQLARSDLAGAIIVFIDAVDRLDRTDKAALAYGAQLARGINQPHVALAVGDGAVVDWGSQPVDAVLKAHAQAYAPDLVATSVSKTIDEFRPTCVIFGATIPGGGDIARRVAVAQGLTPLIVDPTRQEATLPVPDGSSRGSRHPETSILIVEAAEPTFEDDPRRSPTFFDIGDSAMPSRFTDLGTRRQASATASLAEADLVLCAGDGITDWRSFMALGEKLGAVIGGTRVVCDAGRLPRDRQIGASGSSVRALCYMGLGVSGSPQHVQGLAGCEHIVAVNTDLHAALVRQADLAVIADAQCVMPALLDLLEAELGG